MSNTGKPKQKKCKVCGKKFPLFNSLAMVCSVDCSIKYGKNNEVQEKVRKQLNKIARDKIKTRSEHLKDAQTVFNTFIRERDKKQPCISCGTRKDDIQYHAGHFKSVGAHPELRFNELNVSKQCSRCNNYLSGNLNAYRANLINKIGLDKVEWLEGHHEPKKYTIEEIKQIKADYRLKLKQLKRGEQC